RPQRLDQSGFLRAAERAAVTDHDDASVRVAVGDPMERSKHALSVLLPRLAVPAAVGETLLDLFAREPLPAAHVDLAKVGIDVDGEAVLGGDRGRRLARAAQIARVDGVEALGGEGAGELARLGSARVVERRV